MSRLARRAPANSLLSALTGHSFTSHSGLAMGRHSQDEGEMIECSQTDNFRQRFLSFSITNTIQWKREVRSYSCKDSANHRFMSNCVIMSLEHSFKFKFNYRKYLELKKRSKHLDKL